MTGVKENKNYVNAEYLKNIAKKQGKGVKQESLRLMDIREDSYVLDVGCGPAVDTVPFSEFIDEDGLVVGVDCDPKMVAEANVEVKKRHVDKNIWHVAGDVQSLPFGDGEFDRVHAERLFQVLPKSATLKVFGEMHRVLKKGGVIVLADTDWASASVNFSDTALERRLLHFFASQMRPNGFAGRHLMELLQGAGYEDVKVEVMPVVTREFSQTPFGNWLTAEATKTKTASKQEMDQWPRELEEKTVQGTFLSHVNMVIVSGKKK